MSSFTSTHQTAFDPTLADQDLDVEKQEQLNQPGQIHETDATGTLSPGATSFGVSGTTTPDYNTRSVRTSFQTSLPGRGSGLDSDDEEKHGKASSEDETKRVEQQQSPSQPKYVDVDGQKSILVEFDPKDKDDLENPKNWPKRKRLGISLMVASNAFLVSCFASAYLDVAPVLAAIWDTSATVSKLPFTFYVICWGFGPLLLAPAGEALGRKWVYVFSSFMWTVFHVGAARAENMATMIVVRTLASFFGTASMVNGSATAVDLFEGVERAGMISLYCLLVFLGPILGPIVGGYVVEYATPIQDGWRWIFYAAIIAGTAVTVAHAIAPETHEGIILSRKAKRLREESAKNGEGTNYVSAMDLDNMGLLERFKKATVGALRMIVLEPAVLGMSIWQTTVLGVVYIFFEGFPHVFQGQYGFTPGQVGLSFIGIGIGMISCCLWTTSFGMKRYVAKIIKNKGVPTPEMHMDMACIYACALPISLLWFGYSTRTHWICPIIGSVLYGYCMIGILLASFSYTTFAYGPLSASAFAAQSLIRSCSTGTFPLFGTAFYNNLGTENATLILACVSIAEIAIPFVLWKYGPQIRKRSKMSVK
ncbi:MFS general substrate transporter [Violaceomyces palustris]|uniref:MFS general substrate transporter n=1 Tax=Violaceomyces palustris TaxID=1673888 RepID=A0ACD0NVY2_9BASI|nr:MFS general substrate transporter [Violaceomyces palustris]